MSDNHQNDHPLIEQYLKKSIWSRLGRLFFTLILLTPIAGLASWYAWGVIGSDKRQELRETYPAIEKLAAYVEHHGFQFDTPPQDTDQANGRPGSSPKQANPAPRPAREPRDETPIIDMRDEALLAKAASDPDPATQSSRKPSAPALQPQQIESDPVRRKTGESGWIQLSDGTIMRKDEFHARAREERGDRLAKVETLLEQGGFPVRMKAWDRAHPLTWDDFANQNVSEEKSFAGAYILSGIYLSSSRNSFLAFAYMEPNLSWCRPGMRNDYGLAHEQLHFDISEIFARQLRASLAKIPPHEIDKANEAYRRIVDEMNRTQTRYDDETQHGISRELQSKWAESVADALEKLNLHYWKPKWPRSSLHPVTHFYKAQLYELGIEGSDQSLTLAAKWYRKAVVGESAAAANNLARMHLFGHGVKQNEKKAFRLFRRGAKAGSPYAQFNLGVMYLHGYGVKPSKEKAVKWFTAAADGNPHARKALIRLEREAANGQTAQADRISAK
ncbi:Sel1 repeat family protein [Sulfidibacter corallicola]|uniref:Sel1 repeat family protein n=1 Tax=Sulfidibacter corallicola TaxID=2818388 RepID=A0A8A4TR11_SULCO|nr:sel1 repeat family protein [Sulfidibacter corallicola]QTD48955.1 sel1 repeat family protein [Sulfidibacter corallicola]